MREVTTVGSMDKTAFKVALKSLNEQHFNGAGDLVRRCLKLLADSALHAPAKDVASLKGLLANRSSELRAGRFDLAPLDNLLGSWQAKIQDIGEGELEEWRWQAADVAMALLDDSRTAVRRLALNVKNVVSDGATVLTHGPSSTIRESLSALAERNVRVIVTECRPNFGGREIARKLVGWGISTTLITDAQMGMAVREADCVLVGAESILADGTVMNQVGTYLLALAAHDRGVPLYVCCESFKRHGSQNTKPVFREEDGAELGVNPAVGLRVRNLSVDATPGWLVTGWINEAGVSSL